MKTKIAFLFVILAIPSHLYAQGSLPAKPEPAARQGNREFAIQTGAIVLSWTADTVTTRQSFIDNPHNVEGGYVFTGSRSVPKIMAGHALIDLAAVIVGYEIRTRVRNPNFQWLWRLPMMYRTLGQTQCAIGNARTLRW